MKFHVRTRLIESFPTIFRTWWCGEEKLHFTPFHTLRQLKRDEARFHHLGGSQSSERGTGRNLYAGFGEAKFGYRTTYGLGAIIFCTHTLKVCLGRFLSQFRSARLIPSGGNALRHASVGVRCEMV